MKIKQILTILTLGLFSIFANAQEIKFTINKPFDEAIRLISNFSNKYTPTNRIGEAAVSEKEFRTTISLVKLKILNNSNSTYLSLVYKNLPTRCSLLVKQIGKSL